MKLFCSAVSVVARLPLKVTVLKTTALKTIASVMLCSVVCGNVVWADVVSEKFVGEKACQPQLADDFVVKVHTGEGVFASGIRINREQVVTVLHALPQSGRLQVSLGDYAVEAELVDSHQGYDLALLKLEAGPHLSALPVYSQTSNPQAINSQTTYSQPAYPRMLYRDLQPQEPVWAVGFTSKGLRFQEGVFLQKKISGVLSSADIQGGFSGGPLLVCYRNEWMVAGLLRAYRVGVQQGEITRRGVSVATPAAALVKFLFLSPGSEAQWAATP